MRYSIPVEGKSQLMPDWPMGSRSRPLRVLLVEDELLVALATAAVISDMGYEIVGPVRRVQDALTVINEDRIDFAVLDINLGDEKAYPIADLLAERQIPFAFVTGYSVADMEATYRKRPLLQKPFAPKALTNLIMASHA